eukprot:TRINITY_DN60355_c0_g1_i1.p2 TRINITY_DN60355_c0_g1~~TRINITY_DN60355_c0_g1_i1.p2  ORF type:complete len:437 (+),score=76.42 TRINITY_DN60355_c0_g1_i1:90-1400(+)
MHGGGSNFEPIIGGHKSHSLERELRERGLHASANAVAAQGDEHYEGPQGNPAPGSGSPQRNRVTAAGSPRRDLAAYSTGSPAPAHGGPCGSDPGSLRRGDPYAAGSYAPPVSGPSPASYGAPGGGYTAGGGCPPSGGGSGTYAGAGSGSYAAGGGGYGGGGGYAGGGSAYQPGALGGGYGTRSASGSGGRGPGEDPIIGGHKSHSLEKELRERGLHASANAAAAQGDEHYEGPQGWPAPGSGSPQRNRVTSAGSPRRGPAAQDVPLGAGGAQSSYWAGGAQESHSACGAQSTYAAVGAQPLYQGRAAPPPPADARYGSGSGHGAGYGGGAGHCGGSPPGAGSRDYGTHIGSPAAGAGAVYAPSGGSPAPRGFSGSGGSAGSYEPPIGGHKSNSMEKELRDRGLHAQANAVAMQGDQFYDGAGSPQRNRVLPTYPNR